MRSVKDNSYYLSKFTLFWGDGLDINVLVCLYVDEKARLIKKDHVDEEKTALM